MTVQTEFDPAIPSGVWEQDAPVGGADVHGQLPAQAHAVVAVGITTTREVPALRATFGRVALAASSVQRVLGRQPQRRRLHLTIIAAGACTVTLSDDQQQASTGYGMQLVFTAAGQLVLSPWSYADQLYAAVAGASAATVTFMAEIDQG